MEDIKKLTTEVVNMRTDVLYLVRLVEKLEIKISKLETQINQPKLADPFAGKIIEKL
jgi:hypothetical protein